MLTDLSFLSIGAHWPPEDERKRLKRYAENKLLFDAKHELVFRQNWERLRRDGGDSIEIAFNWPKRLSTLWADLLLSETPTASAGDNDGPEDETLQRIIKWTDFWNTAYEAAIDVSRYGTAVFKVRFDEWARIEVNSPAIWFPVVEPANIKHVKHHVLAWLSRFPGDDKRNTRRILNVEIHSPGQIEYRYYQVDGHDQTKIRRELNDDTYRWKTEETGVDDFLVRPVHNLTTSDEVYGQDDYEDVQSIICELEVRAAQISKILDRHSDPNMYGDESALDVDPETGQSTFRGGGKFFPVSQGGQIPGYVTWDGNLEAAFRQFDLLLEQFYALSETSPAAFGQLKQGLAESGSALKRLMQAPLAKAGRIRMRFDPALREVLKLASKLEVVANMQDAMELENVSIAWRDGLPDDEMERTQIMTMQVSSGVRSRQSAVQELQELDGEALDEELARIEDEQEPPISRPPFSVGV